MGFEKNGGDNEGIERITNIRDLLALPEDKFMTAIVNLSPEENAAVHSSIEAMSPEEAAPLKKQMEERLLFIKVVKDPSAQNYRALLERSVQNSIDNNPEKIEVLYPAIEINDSLRKAEEVLAGIKVLLGQLKSGNVDIQRHMELLDEIKAEQARFDELNKRVKELIATAKPIE